MKARVLVITISILCSTTVWAQSEPLFSQYLFNKLIINPAYTGSRNAFAANVVYRQQWVSMPGAPRTYNISAHAPFKKQSSALGATFYGDQFGPYRSIGFNASYAYRIFFNRGTLAFGLNAGIVHSRLDLSAIDGFQLGDQAFDQLGKTSVNPVAGAGIYFSNDRLAVGFSTPQVFNNKMLNTKNGLLANHYYFTFDFLLNPRNKIVLHPSMLLKYTPESNAQLDANLNIVFYERLWLGAGFRTDNSYIFNCQYHFKMKTGSGYSNFRLGYAYDLVNKSYRAQSSGSHEVFLFYDFSKIKNKILTPRYF